MAGQAQEAIIEPIPEPQQEGAVWQARIGAESRRLIERKLPGAEGERVLESAAAILSRGTAPNGATRRTTGLVVGYVQSGKTLSFTTAIALARDNGFRLVIVVAGT